VSSLKGHDEALALMNDEISARLDRQVNTGDKVDTKAVFLAGFAAAAAQFLATQRHLPAVLEGIAFVAYGISFISAVGSITLTKYKDFSLKKLFDEYVLEPKSEILGRLFSLKVEVFEYNALKYHRKALLWWLSLLSFALGLLTSIIALLGR
jgi:hypothetical protein